MTHIRYRRPLPYRLARRMASLPDPVVQLLAGDPVEIDGRVLDRSVQLFLAVADRRGLRALGAGDHHRRRADMRRATRLGMPVATGLHVSERVIPGPSPDEGDHDLRLRIYRPWGSEDAPPAIVYFHGGGWVVGDLDTHDASCRILAAASGCVVVSVDYRLAPEHPYPAAVHDSHAAFEWVVSNAAELSLDPGAVAVMGDSAGANLAAVVSQLARDGDGPTPVAQGLVYPSLDFRMVTRSIELFADGFLLSREDMDWFRERYLPDRSRWEEPTASPLLADDLAGLPPTWVWTAGFDPLRDEGRAYADALGKAGVTTHYRCYDDMIHGFFGLGVVPGGVARVEEVARQMGELVRAS